MSVNDIQTNRSHNQPPTLAADCAIGPSKPALSRSTVPPNKCGECRACCIHLPIADPELQKSAGVPCRHLCESGCSLYGTASLPSICREYLCLWREDKWLGSRPAYRPDRLGVLFQAYGNEILSIYELRPEALQQAPVIYIKNRLRRHFEVVKLYPFGVFDGLKFDVEEAGSGISHEHDDKVEWRSLGGGEFIVKRLPLPNMSSDDPQELRPKTGSQQAG